MDEGEEEFHGEHSSFSTPASSSSRSGGNDASLATPSGSGGSLSFASSGSSRHATPSLLSSSSSSSSTFATRKGESFSNPTGRIHDKGTSPGEHLKQVSISELKDVLVGGGGGVGAGLGERERMITKGDKAI